RFAHSIASSQIPPLTGINGQTSVPPLPGCAPLSLPMSINSVAILIARNAAATAASGSPTKVTTVRFVLAPGSTSSNDTPSTDSIASVICRITFCSRPSEKFGTHSISFGIRLDSEQDLSNQQDCKLRAVSLRSIGLES